MTPSIDDDSSRIYKQQVLMSNYIKIYLQISKFVSQAAMNVVRDGKTEPSPFDLILLIAVYESAMSKKKMVESALSSFIEDGHYKNSLLKKFYNDFPLVASKYFSCTLKLAICLLKRDETKIKEFGLKWLRLLFLNQCSDKGKQREIFENVWILFGEKNKKVIHSAIRLFDLMINNDKEVHFIEENFTYLKLLLEKIDDFSCEQFETFYNLLCGAFARSEKIRDSLQDELSIVMRKYLQSNNEM